METIVQALSNPQSYAHATGAVEVVETHISWVFLTELWAYKVKKPLNLGFLDFSTLEKRRHSCYEELRLNRRLCPEIYHAVVPIVRTGKTLLVDAEGEVVDYAVKMVRFDRRMELDRMLAQKLLTEEHIDTLASMIAAFHIGLLPLPAENGFGHPDNLIKPMLHNFTSMEPIISGNNEIKQLALLKAWTIQEHQRLNPLLLQRKHDGFIRQCHGDIHTGNMVLWKKRIFIFDCIEFNETLSNIDVISDLAFLFMDLEHGGEPELAWRLLNNYLAETGDYAALPLLRFYALYRAMVRAKVTAIRYKQTIDTAQAEIILDEHRSYIAHALSSKRTKQPMLIITFGVSGSGKTALSQTMAQTMHGIHIRSDIERKRLAGMKPDERQNKNEKLYSEEMSHKTYQRLFERATICLKSGIYVIVDATFLKRCNRQIFIKLAEKLKIPCRILHCHASEKVLMERVQHRTLMNNDASDADTDVLTMQLESKEELTEEEKTIAIAIDTEKKRDAAAIALLLQSITA